MNDDATMTEAGGKYAGMDRYEARKAIVDDLEEQGLPASRSRSTPTTSAPATAAAPPSSRWSPSSGLSRWSRWQSRPSTLSAMARSSLIPERFEQDLLQLDGEHQGLVYLPSALVGPPHPGLLLRRLRRGDRRQGSAHHLPEVRQHPACTRMRTRWTPGSARRCGRSRPWAGRTRPRSWNISTRLTPWSPATTSSSSGLPA